LVSTDSGTVDRSSEATTSNTQAAQTAERRDLQQLPGQAQLTYVAALRESIQDKGFSEAIAQRVTTANRESTVRHYGFLWGRFSDWCDQRKIDSLQTNGPEISEFLVFLRDTEHKRPGTIQNYLTAISNVMRANRDYIPSLDPILKALMKSFWLASPRKSRISPDWDLAFVLDGLRRPPFEPLGTVEYKWLTFKTVFLVATGNRRSEIHAFLHDNLTHPERHGNWSSASIQIDPLFLAKNQTASNEPSSDFVTIPSLKDYLGPGLDDELLLCPVRALKKYYNRMDYFRSPEQKRLFISYNTGMETDITANTISNWLKQTIVYIYQHSTKKERKLFNIESTELKQVSAHDVRKLSTSWALDQHVPMHSILKACCWRAQTTFTSFYLQQMYNDRSKMFRLGPIVAAKHVVRPERR
jgi:hypothetical protein